MAELTKQALKVANNTEFPNNNNGAITPSNLRGFNVDMIDSLVDEIGYNADSASWNQQIDALEQFTASQQPSFNALNSFTASQLVINSGVNSFTQSASGRLNALEIETANLEAFTSSINEIRDDGVLQGYSTRFFFNGLVSASIVPNVGGAIANVTIQSDGTKLNTSSFNAFTQSYINDSASFDSRVDALEAFSTSLDTNFASQTEFNAFTQSADQRLDSIEAQSGSWVTSAITASSLITASFAAGTLTFTKGNGTTFGVVIPDVSGSTIETGSFATTGSNSFVGNQTITGSLHQSGTFYPDVIDWVSSSIQQGTGSYILTTDTNGVTQYDTYPNIALALNPYITGSLPAGVVSGSSQLTASYDLRYALSGSGGGALPSGILSSSVTNFTDYSQSVDTRINNIVVGTGFATTGSNSFTGDQNITGSVRVSQQLQMGTTNLGPTIQSLDSGTPAGFTGLQVNAGESGSFSMRTLYGGGIASANLEAYNTFPSFNTGGKISAKSGGGIDVLGYAGNVVISGSNTTLQGLTYPNTDGTNGQVITTNGSGVLTFTTVSGSSINTGSFATTGSNTFVGNQTVVGNVTISGSTDNHLYINRPGGSDVLRLGVSNNGNTFDFHITGSADQQLWLIDNQGGTWGNTFSGFIQAQGKTTINAPFTASQGAQINGGDLRVAGNLTASLQQGYVWVGNSSGVSTTVPTSSFGGGGALPSGLLSSSVTNFTDYSASVDTRINNIVAGTGFATTGSNTFTGDQTLINAAGNTVTLSNASGSLMLVAKTFTSASTHLTASAGNQVNLIFKNNNNTADTIISGSNNIFTNPSAPTADYKRIIGSNNIVNSATGIPQVTGSMGTPITMLSNYFGSGTTTIRGPITGSGYSISNNSVVGTLNIGQAGVNDMTRVSALSLTGNQVIGTMTIAASTSTTLPNIASTATVSNNIVVGAMQATMNSSSLSMTGNIINAGSLIIANNHFTTAAGSGSLTLANNLVGGAQISNITVQGANPVGTTNNPVFSGNIMYGATNAAHINADNARTSSTNAYTSLLSTAVFGSNLAITGSSLGTDTATVGSAFVGRFNANDGIRNKTSNVVFAVGTGTATGTRKTGFLIDSGSNTFVEGTLNVSGSSSFTGSLTIQSGSSFFANGNRQFNLGAFSSLVSQSGSANVSQSMNFETTDISSGVSIVSNSQITLANSGTYNIQFSAQLLADTGADDVYIWLKKNGTNVAASAGHVVLANNEELIAAWNYVVDAVANDYYELAWQSTSGDAILLTEVASGNIPSIPSIILTVTQIR